MALATQTSLPVLIPARPSKSALEMAIEIALAGGKVRAEYVMMVDAARQPLPSCTTLRRAGDLRAVVNLRAGRDSGCGTGLGRAQASQPLMALMTETSVPPRAAPCRIIATTSVPLFEHRVRQGSFRFSAVLPSEQDSHHVPAALAPAGRTETKRPAKLDRTGGGPRTAQRYHSANVSRRLPAVTCKRSGVRGLFLGLWLSAAPVRAQPPTPPTAFPEPQPRRRPGSTRQHPAPHAPSETVWGPCAQNNAVDDARPAYERKPRRSFPIEGDQASPPTTSFPEKQRG